MPSSIDFGDFVPDYPHDLIFEMGLKRLRELLFTEEPRAAFARAQEVLIFMGKAGFWPSVMEEYYQLALHLDSQRSQRETAELRKWLEEETAQSIEPVRPGPGRKRTPPLTKREKQTWRRDIGRVRQELKADEERVNQVNIAKRLKISEKQLRKIRGWLTE